MAAVRASRAALPWLRRSAAGCILNVSSINGLVPTPRTLAYSTAKAAVNYYTAALATELAPERIRVNALAPGSIEFPGGQIEALMRHVGMPVLPSEIGENRQDVRDALLCSRDIRDKYLTSSLLWDLGLLATYAESV